MAKDDLIASSDALEILGCSQGQLEEMVARGELRAFRSGGAMKFRREDVMDQKAAKSTEPTIILPAEGDDVLESVDDVEGTQPLVFDDLDILPDADDVTQEMSSPGAPVTDDFIPTVMDDDDLDHTMIDDDLTLDDDEFDLDDDDDFDDDEDEFGDDEDDEFDSGRMTVRRDAAAYVKKPGNPVMSTVLFICTLLMIAGAMVVITEAYRGETVDLKIRGVYGDTIEVQKPFMPEYVKFEYDMSPDMFLKKQPKDVYDNW